VVFIALTSAAGSPGVTTTAVGLALTSDRPTLLVEADPTGGSAVLAGFFRGTCEHSAGLLDLVWAHRDGRLAELLPASTMRFPESTATLLPGVRSHAQARNAAPIWEPLATALSELRGTGQDVVADAGRLGLAGSPEPLLHRADVALLVVRSDLVAVSAARSWAAALRDDFDRIGAADRLGLLLVGPGRPYTAREVAAVLGVPVVASLAWSEQGAAVFSRGSRTLRRFHTSAYLQSLRTAWTAIHARATAADEVLTTGSEARS
jgi:hypothetical protein